MDKVNKKVGVVGIPGGWSSELLADHLQDRTGFRCLIDMERVTCDLSSGEVRHGDLRLNSLDALIIKKAGPDYAPSLLDRLEILRLLAGRGLPVFSEPRRIMKSLNRLSCTINLELGGIPIPPTCVTEDLDEAVRAIEVFGEAVLKPLFTSKARGMRTVHAGTEAHSRIKSFQEAGNPVLYVQKLVKMPDRDLGLVFLGGSYLGAYARVRQHGSWNTTTHNGGTYAPCEPPPGYMELASRAQDIFGLDFTCVDMAETPEGPVVFEVSAFGGFRGLMEATGIDAAAEFVDYVLEEI